MTKLFCDPNIAQLHKDTESMRTSSTIQNLILGFIIGSTVVLLLMFFTGLGQDVPGAGGLTRYQVAEMLYECDRGKYEGYCVADVNIRPSEMRE